MRGKTVRTWVKFYPVPCLQGSIRYQLEPDERSVWYDLVMLSAICATPGVISDNDGRPYPHSFIANRLNVPLELLERTFKKCSSEGRIEENSNGISIKNWKAYQSEYQRQKGYREDGEVEIPNHIKSDKEKQFYKDMFGAFKTELKVKRIPNEGQFAKGVGFFWDNREADERWIDVELIIDCYRWVKENDKFYGTKFLSLQELAKLMPEYLRLLSSGKIKRGNQPDKDDPWGIKQIK